MVFAETNKEGCIDTNHQDRCKFGANKCQNRSTNFTKRRSAPKVIGLRVYLSAYDKIKIIVKTKITETDSGVGISVKEGCCVHIINLSSHGIRVYVRYVCPYCPDIIQTRLN